MKKIYHNDETGVFHDFEDRVYRSADYQDTDELLREIGKALDPFGLEIILGDFGDTNIYFHIGKK